MLVKMDGVVLRSNVKFKTVEGEYVGAGLVIHRIPIILIGNEGKAASVVNLSQSIADTTSHIIENAGAVITPRIVGTIKFQTRYASDKYILNIKVKNQDGSITTIFTQTVNTSDNVDVTISFDVTAPVPTSGELYFEGMYQSNASPGNLSNLKLYYYETDINVTYNSRYRTSYVKCLRAIDLFKAIIAKVTDGAYSGDSSLLDIRTDLVCTSGDALRSLAGAKIKTSLSQFFQSFNSILNIGMGIINFKAVIESKAHWFNAAGIIDLGEVNNLEISSANEFLFNTIRVGYPNQTYEDVNGKSEPNTTQSYSTPIKRVAVELNLVSEYRGDMYGIEFTRMNFDGKTTTDSKSDNETFVMQVEKNGIVALVDGVEKIIHELDRTLNAGATGLIDAPSAINLGITPKHNLFEHGWYLRSVLHFLDLEYIKFLTTDKNADVETDIIEKADVLIGDLPERIFAPILFKFLTVVPDNLQTLLNTNPVRKYRFTYDGMVLLGIAMRTGVEPSTRKAQVYQLLATADNDFTQLINYNG